MTQKGFVTDYQIGSLLHLKGTSIARDLLSRLIIRSDDPYLIQSGDRYSLAPKRRQERKSYGGLLKVGFVILTAFVRAFAWDSS